MNRHISQSIRYALRSISRKWVCAGLALCCLVAPQATAAPVTAKQAASVVKGWLATDHTPLQTVIGQQIAQTKTFRDANATALYHVVTLNPAGFVIVAGDDLIEPIIAFVPNGTFDPSPNNPLGALVTKDLPGRAAKVKGMKTTKAVGPHLNAKNKWNRLSSAAAAPAGVVTKNASVSDVRVSPLTTTAWSQSTVGRDACYNYYTPPYAAGDSRNYLTGCVATAMAQLMRFWNYPDTGVGTASFAIKVANVSQSRALRGGDGTGGVYDWANMADSPSTLNQRKAVGALCADAGVAVGMEYTSTASSAFMSRSQSALSTTFKYNNSVRGYNNNDAIGDGLTAMVNPNLDARCPVLLGIRGSIGGHAVVCDGYGYSSATLYHHLNLGWANGDTAWYALPTIDTSAGTFDVVDDCIYNIWPAGSGEIISGRITTTSGSAMAGVTVTATRTGGATLTTTTNPQGIYAFPQVPSNSQYLMRATQSGVGFGDQTVFTGLSSTNSSVSGNRWAVNFFPDNPTQFAASPVGASTINLSWLKNPSNQNVMVAFSTTNSFGTPTGTYSAGNTIVGGGTVLYNGSATSFSHSGLTPETTYYYKAWSIQPGTTYTSGESTSAVPGEIVTLINEGFEHAGAMPPGWSQASITNAATWTFINGGAKGSERPTNAHTGSYNAGLFYENSAGTKTMLVTPPINFDNNTLNTKLSFTHYMEVWDGDQDELRVFYRTSASGTWTLLATYLDSVATWTQRTISLPNPNGTYQIAFEGYAEYGHGVYIDDVSVVGTPADAPAIIYPTVTLSQALTQSDPTNAPSINFTASFSVPVTDFTTGDVTLSGTAPGTMIATVTGSGMSYNVAVTGMTGAGTVVASIAAAAAHDTAGNANLASTTTDNSVTYELTRMQSWHQQYFGTIGSDGDADDLADPNHNGVPNLMEYALGGDPMSTTTPGTMLPKAIITPGGRLELSLNRLLDRTDITLTVQGSDSLTGSWPDLASSINGAPFSPLISGVIVTESGTGTTRAVKVEDLYPTSDPAHPRRFMRLRVTHP